MERLQKVIAKAGITSRRKAEELILEGKVKVNGIVVDTLGTKVSPEDEIEVFNTTIHDENKVYYVLNKPTRYLCTLSDQLHRHTVNELIDTELRVYPIGRLDYASSGVLLMTNDGEFANLMMHPRYGISKDYEVWVKGELTKAQINQINNGLVLEDGTSFSKAQVTVIRSEQSKTFFMITLHEGKNREIRKMMEHFGLEVISLHRKRYGTISDQGLRIGKARKLKPNEIRQLKDLALKGSNDE